MTSAATIQPPPSNYQLAFEGLGYLHHLDKLCNGITSRWHNNAIRTIKSSDLPTSHRKKIMNLYENSRKECSEKYPICDRDARRALNSVKKQTKKAMQEILSDRKYKKEHIKK